MAVVMSHELGVGEGTEIDLPQSMFGEVGGHFKIEGRGGHWGNTEG